MDPIGAAVALVLVASAFYRTTAGKREAFTYGLWTAAFAMAVGALVVPLDAALNSITGLGSLSQLSLAGVIGAYRTKQDYQAAVGSARR
jgi:hypothetical protein